MKKKNWYTSHITLCIFVGLLLGIVVGFALPADAAVASGALGLISSVYMNALRMMIFPLVFCSIVVGIKNIGSVSRPAAWVCRACSTSPAPPCLPACWACSCRKPWAWARA